jgi:hypothetical protein
VPPAMATITMNRIRPLWRRVPKVCLRLLAWNLLARITQCTSRGGEELRASCGFDAAFDSSTSSNSVIHFFSVQSFFSTFMSKGEALDPE